jgi:hypothetical protein
MLTHGDEYPIRQTAEPVAYAGTDRNFYDRYFFSGYKADGSDFFALAFGVYPHLNVADAHFSCLRRETQHCIHASRILNMERIGRAGRGRGIRCRTPADIMRPAAAREVGGYASRSR